MTTEPKSDAIALVDLDSTVADYDKALRKEMRALEAPNEPSYADRYSNGFEPAYIEARRKLIQQKPGFWRNLERIPLGFEVVDELRKIGFSLHVLTKGPQKNGAAWGEKLEWSREHLPDATVTVTGDKSIVYGRVLVDDFPPYFLSWLANRPRGLVISVAHPWNEGFKKDGAQAHPNVVRYDGTDVIELREALRRARDRESGAPLHVPVKPGRCEAAEIYNRVMNSSIDFKKGTFTVRQWDGMDGCWSDCHEATGVSGAEALLTWMERTESGSKRVSFNEIDYYKIFSADTRMAWDGSEGREMFRGGEDEAEVAREASAPYDTSHPRHRDYCPGCPMCDREP